MSGLNPDGAGDFFAVEFKLDYIFGFDAQALRHRGTDLDSVVPSELVHRLGEFLEPAVVGELSVVDGGIAADVELDGVGIGGFGFRWRGCRFCGHRFWSKRRAFDPT